MECPVCNYLNAATSVRCLQCGTTLIHEAVGHSPEYKRTVANMDHRMYGGIGAFFGLGLAGALSLAAGASNREIYGFAVGGAFVGGILGRLVLRIKQRGE
jgi:hypothetical protein